MSKNQLFFKRKRFWKRLLLFIAVVPLLIFGAMILVFHFTQDAIIQNQIESLNKGHKGVVSVGDSHLSPFKNFPYTSIKIDDVKILENKGDSASVILDVEDIYVGFNILDLIRGDYDIQTLLIEEGVFNLIIHKDGSNNLTNAFATEGEATDSQALHIHLNKISLKNLDIHNYDEGTKIDVETYINKAEGGFKANEELISSHIDSKFV